MIKLKSFHADSIVRKHSISFQTTASVGTVYQLVPFNCILTNIMEGVGIATTSDKAFTVRNLSLSQSLLNCATINGSAAVGSSFKIGLSSSDAGAQPCATWSGTLGRPYISANSLLSFSWSASKGDSCFVANYKRTEFSI